jgi:integrase
MPTAAKGPRLWLRKPRRSRAGRVTHAAVYLIRDGEYSESTGCGAGDRDGAERKLEAYLNRKHSAEARRSLRDPADIPIADVLALYGQQVAPKHARPRETAQRIERLLAFFGDKMLDAINGDLCRAFVKTRSTPTAARDDLTVLRSAINHHRQEGHCEKIVSVILPEKPVGRERWCTRSEAAKLLWAAWRFREMQKGQPTDRRTRRHVARFILVALYTGTRAGSVCAAALEPTEGRGWIDLDKGIFYRRPAGTRETKKRRPPVPLPRRLLVHLRRWHRLGQRFAVEWNGEAVGDVDKAFRNVAGDAGLPDVTPHVLRHTAATWLMQLGGDPWQVAEYLGMTLKTLLERYGHHHPDHLSGPREAFDQPPQLRHRRPATEREHAPSNVMKIADRSRQ